MNKMIVTGNREFDVKPLRIGLLVIVLFAGMFIKCVVPADPVVETLHVGMVAASDTISPWGGIRIFFSVPANDTVLPRFEVDPPVYSFTVEMNSARDTAYVAWSEPLAGAAYYVIGIDEFISASGERLSSDDSISFVTYQTEKEPNNTRETADTLAATRWGSIATVNDTDWFAVTLMPGGALVLNSMGSRTSCSLSGRSDVLSPERIFRQSDTLLITDTLPSPLHVAVFASHRSVGGYYEIRQIIVK